MKIRMKAIAFIFLILFVLSHAQVGLLPALLFASNVITWSLDFSDYVKTTHQTIASFIGNFGGTPSQEEYFIDGVTGKVFEGLSRISTHLDKVSELINNRTQELKLMIKKLGLQIDIKTRMDGLVQKMGTIDNLYDDLLRYVPTEKTGQFNRRSLCRFAYHQLYDYTLTRDVDAMYNVIVPSRPLETSLLTEIYEDFETNKDELCGIGHSTLDYLYSIYISLMLVEMKAFAMTVFFHHLLFRSNGTDRNCEYLDATPDIGISIAQTKFREHLEAYSNEFLDKMGGASREFRACDQEKDFIRDETYYELEGAVQAIIQLPPNDVDSVGDPDHMMQCSDVHETYGTPAVYCDYRWQFCTTPVARNCLGYTRKCHSPSEWINACVAKNSPRRYEWINWQHDTEALEAAIKNCTEHMIVPRSGKPIPLNEYNAFAFLFTTEYRPCICECNDNDVDSLSTHVFNLQWVESDVSKNMVITGIRFVVEHRIMQLQIQQGRLDSNFRIRKANWKPIKDISEEIRAVRLNKKLRGESPKLVENVDYLIVNQAINNAINFDTLHVSYPHVLTGVRFYFSRDKGGGIGRIQIAIKGTRFDHITGELCGKCDPEIVTSRISHTQRYHYPRRNVNRPKFPTIPIKPPGQYVQIDASDLIHDSGQTTLPYFDALSLVSNPPSPQGGLGIFHRGAGDFTGFVSLKFVSLDYLTYMRESLNEIEEQKKILKIRTNSNSLRHGSSSRYQ